MSRQPTWDLAQSIQGRMFETAASLGGLRVQLVYFRGFGECRASHFVDGGQGLAALMSKIGCRGGHTQIAKVLPPCSGRRRARSVSARSSIVGDAMEENVDACAISPDGSACSASRPSCSTRAATRPRARRLREIARLTGGAYAAFDASAPQRLAELLSAAAAYAAGGRPALERRAAAGESAARLLLSQMG